MDISKADSKNIDIDTRDSLLADFGVNLEAAIATGTEAEVYALDEHKVLKYMREVSVFNTLRH